LHVALGQGDQRQRNGHRLTGVHLRERAHTAEFWARLRRIIPEYEELRQWLADEGGTYDL
jgi:hypothetical protein